MARTIAILSLAAFVTGCAATYSGSEPPAAGEGACDAGDAQQFIGEAVSQRLGADALRLSGARDLRWIPPNSAVTMDYRPNRLNIEYDETGAVTAIRCG